MRAVLCERYGPFDDLVLAEVPSPELRPGTVRLQVLAAGVNYVDNLIVGGRYQVKTPTPFVPGFEFVGRIIELADDVARDAPHLSVGARVLALSGGGGFAEEVVVPAHIVTIVPDGITDGQAATFVQSYMTAAFALRHRAGAERDDSLLVIGAGSGVGLAAVDVAASMRMRVIAAASTEEKRRLALDRGAEVAFDVNSESITTDIRELMAADGKDGVDHVYDPVGGDRAETWLRCLATGGQYLVVGFVAGIPSLPLNHVLLRNRRVTGVDWGGWSARQPAENAALLNELVHQISIGRLRPVEPTAYPLDRTVDALRDLAERRASGKLVVIP
ncbi:NADPH:quinone oxidoreductase family protein [Ilumatobacter sp.]|uniref:NADPH:quinone oxidoreductase family protein n=1 Tax=Ilumatobacter sp. TaxID=1967498 RepID=UPI003AF66946